MPGKLRQSTLLSGFLTLCLLSIFFHCGELAAAQEGITVSAAVSLKDALEETSRNYQTENPGVVVHLNLGGSGTLQRQIEQGAPVDVFISASVDDFERLDSKGLLLPGSRKDLVRNKLVLIVPAEGAPVKDFQDLAKPAVKRIAIGERQTVPAGKYAQEVLSHFGLYDQLKPKFVFGNDVRQVLTFVAEANVDAGFVYASDAQTSSRVRIVAIAPDDSHSPIIYPMAIIKTSPKPTAARGFELFLLTTQSQGIFRKYGFLPVNR